MEATKANAQAILNQLAERFHIAPPRLDWHGNTRNGKYRYKARLVMAGPNAWRGWVASLVHEFAHHLQFMRAAQTKGEKLAYYLRPHGREFKTALWDAVTAWYGDPLLYPWLTEYRALRNLPAQRGCRWTKLDPAPTMAGKAAPADLAALFETARLKMRDPKRKACKHGHPICLANACVADLRRAKVYCCQPCIDAYRKAKR